MDRFNSLLQQDSGFWRARETAVHDARRKANEWVAGGLDELHGEAKTTNGAISFQTFTNSSGFTDSDVLLNGRVARNRQGEREISLLIRWTKSSPKIVIVSAGAVVNELPIEQLADTTPLEQMINALEAELLRRQKESA